MNNLIKISLQDLKDKPYQELIKLYQDTENGLIRKFRSFEKEFPALKTKNKIYKSNEYNEAFILFSETFFHHYNLMWNQYKNSKSESIQERMNDARIFFESCNIHATKINTHYLQPLTIEKAKQSIFWGKISVSIGVIAIVLSVWFSFSNETKTNASKQDSPKQEMVFDGKSVIGGVKCKPISF